MTKTEFTWSEIVNSFQASFNNYEYMALKWEADIRHIIDEYRQENQSLRRTPAPKYFETAYSLSEIDKSAKMTFKSQSSAFMDDEERSETLSGFVELNQSHFNNAIESISDSYTAYGTKMEGIVNDYPIY